jgi:hypothetical protein
VWLKHLTLLSQSGLRTIPSSVAELGPGESLGVGLAALLSGASRYYALDVVAHGNVDKNLRVLDELVERFRSRAPQPIKGWPDFDLYLDSRLFPSHILTEGVLAKTLDPHRISAIREALRHPDRDGKIVVRYVAPWTQGSAIERSSIDLIYSHSVLQHVVDVPTVFRCCASWLREDGWMSHQVDFTSQGITKAWNGHWQYPEWLWKIIVGGRPFLINRHTASAQIRMLKDAGFNTVMQMRNYRSDGMPRAQLSAPWKSMSDDEVSCSDLFLQVRKHPDTADRRRAAQLLRSCHRWRYRPPRIFAFQSRSGRLGRMD